MDLLQQRRRLRRLNERLHDPLRRFIVPAPGGGCRLTVGGKVKFACVDGPDFDGHKVDWDLAVKRNQMYRDFEAHKYEETCNLFKKEAE